MEALTVFGGHLNKWGYEGDREVIVNTYLQIRDSKDGSVFYNTVTKNYLQFVNTLDKIQTLKTANKELEHKQPISTLEENEIKHKVKYNNNHMSVYQDDNVRILDNIETTVNNFMDIHGFTEELFNQKHFDDAAYDESAILDWDESEPPTNYPVTIEPPNMSFEAKKKFIMFFAGKFAERFYLMVDNPGFYGLSASRSSVDTGSLMLYLQLKIKTVFEPSLRDDRNFVALYNAIMSRNEYEVVETLADYGAIDDMTAFSIKQEISKSRKEGYYESFVESHLQEPQINY